ncbi:MAG TPA: hypothetical protein VGE12_23005 [Noviherbaspirillum sp.]
MAGMMSMQSLRERITEKLREEGWAIVVHDTALLAMREDIRSRWFLGSRRVSSQLHCRFDEVARVLHVQEVAREVAVGIPPPALRSARYRQQGTHVRETFRDTGPFGSGTLEYGKAQEWLHTLCREAGWSLATEINPCNNVDIKTRMN